MAEPLRQVPAEQMPEAVTDPKDQSTGQLVRSISTDLGTLVKKEIELARQEIVEAVTARLVAAGTIAGAGVFGLFVLAFLALAAATALDAVVPVWASRLIVAGAFLVVAVAAIAFGVARVRKTPVAPETKRTVREDVEWAKAQLKP